MKRFVDTFKNEHILYKIITVMIIAVTVFFLYRVVKNTIVGLDFPNEILEAANVNLTNSILSDNVPYDLKNVVTDGSEPPINYEYPFLNSVVAAGLSFITGGNTIIAHYLLSFLSMIGTAVLGSIIIFRYSRTTVGATMGFIVLMFCHWRYGYISASPDGLGLFITMIALYVACIPGRANRNESETRGVLDSEKETETDTKVEADKKDTKGKKLNIHISYKPLVCALLTVAAFYTKQYFAGVCVSIFIYFWLINKKEALKYFGWCVVLLGITVALINWKWPLFWSYSILCLFYGTFQGWGMAGVLQFLDQIKYLGAIFIGMFAVLVVALALKLKDRKKEKAAGTELKLEGKMEKSNALPLFVIQIPIQFAILFVVGRNDGAFLTYFLQLLIPSVMIVALIVLEQMEIKERELIFGCAYGLLVVFTLYFGWGKLPMHMYTEEEVKTWHKAYELIAEYREKGPVYQCQLTAYDAMKNGDSVYNTGHDGDIRIEKYNIWKEDELRQKIFPYAVYMYEENLMFMDIMREKIKNHEIEMIVLEPVNNVYTNEDDLVNNGYRKISAMDLQLGNMDYEAQFWTLNLE